MSDKYRLPNFKDFLVAEGMTFNEFYDEAFKTVGSDNKSRRLWSDALNTRGAGLLSVNKMIQVGEKTFARLERSIPSKALEKEKV